MHSFVSCLMHCVWATKERRPLIKPDLQQRLWPYLGGIARENKMKALVVGGVEDHVHILLSMPSTISLAKAVQLLKPEIRRQSVHHGRSAAFRPLQRPSCEGWSNAQKHAGGEAA